MRELFRIALPAGIVAGTLDILYAVAVWGARGVPASRVLKSVASGWLGRAAFEGGAGAAVLGLASHMTISFGMAAAYVATATHVRELARRPWLYGFLYGVLLYLVMNYIVLPLSESPMRAPTKATWLIAFLPHVLCVAWPIAWITRRGLTAVTPVE